MHFFDLRIKLIMLELIKIHKEFDKQPLLTGTSFSVEAGETVCLLGPSGSGKSTLLRIIAVLEQPESGQVLWNGAELISEPAHKRNFGLVFQDYVLFPHLSVEENVAFGLKMQKTPKEEIKLRVTNSLELVNMSGFARRRVADLSGGEQQRVAIARSLANDPPILLADEPTGNLDSATGAQILELLVKLHQGGKTIIMVTHEKDIASYATGQLHMLDGVIDRIEGSANASD